jgi:hypothetical protein
MAGPVREDLELKQVYEVGFIHLFLFVVCVLRKDGSACGSMIGKWEGIENVGSPTAPPLVATVDPTANHINTTPIYGKQQQQ